MTLKLIGKKKGMTRLFDKDGNQVVCTVIAAEPNVVTQIKRKEKDGYEAIQMSASKVKSKKNISKPLQGHLAKAGDMLSKTLAESRVSDLDSYSIGQEIGVDYFNDAVYVDVKGVSKGKGYQGVMKRHHFSGGPASHGSGFHRHAGSTGMRSTPGRCLPGVKKAGRMGAEKVTVQNLRVIRIDQEKRVIIVEGAVPGAPGGLVYVTKAKKKITVKKN